MRRGGLLVVTAHPDDESLIAGGVLAACSAAGVPTAVVCLTRGEWGPIADPALATQATLAEVRVAELEAACATLGVEYVHCCSHSDGSLASADDDEVVAELAAIIAQARPAAIVTFDADGLYQHPDHMAAHEFTVAAIARSAPEPVLYEAIWPAESSCELVAALRARGLPCDLWGFPPDEFGCALPEGVVEVDVAPFVERKLAALRAHRTQLGADHALAAIPGDLAARFLGVERFRCLSRNGRTDWLTRVAAGVGHG
jgi:N-acetyl-1-D-myo-inositol-2-amino-2-deoxy-alpha-D-glucopyranoside deacetylase